MAEHENRTGKGKTQLGKRKSKVMALVDGLIRFDFEDSMFCLVCSALLLVHPMV